MCDNGSSTLDVAEGITVFFMRRNMGHGATPPMEETATSRNESNSNGRWGPVAMWSMLSSLRLIIGLEPLDHDIKAQASLRGHDEDATDIRKRSLPLIERGGGEDVRWSQH